MKITEEFCVHGYYRTYDGIALLKHALHNTCPDMMKSIGKDDNGRSAQRDACLSKNDIKVRDAEGIQLANSKIDEIRNGFSDWLEEQSPEFFAWAKRPEVERKERLTDMYNRKFFDERSGKPITTAMCARSMTVVTRLSPTLT